MYAQEALKNVAALSLRSWLPEFEFRATPSVCAEERRSRRNRARDCLSAASSSGTPAGPSTAGCPQRSGGTQTVGSPFFSLGFFGESKKSKSPAAATERHQDLAMNAVIESRRRLRQAQPEREGERGTEAGTTFGIGRFRGRSTNSPRLRLALRVLRFATQRNCDTTPKTRLHVVPVDFFGL